MCSVCRDCPFIPHDLAERLEVARQQAGLPLACAAAPAAGRILSSGSGLCISARNCARPWLPARGKIDRFTGRFGCATAEWPVEPFDPFFNVNTPEELVEAERLAALVGGPATP